LQKKPRPPRQPKKSKASKESEAEKEAEHEVDPEAETEVESESEHEPEVDSGEGIMYFKLHLFCTWQFFIHELFDYHFHDCITSYNMHMFFCVGQSDEDTTEPEAQPEDLPEDRTKEPEQDTGTWQLQLSSINVRNQFGSHFCNI
jgi:hypothetical protein